MKNGNKARHGKADLHTSKVGVCYCHANFCVFQFKNLVEYATVIPTLGQLRQGDCKSECSLGYTANLRTA